MGSRYHVKIDGIGYLLREGSYRRSGGSASAGEWRRWSQTDWRGGFGWPVRKAEGRWSRGHGVEIGIAGELGLGAALEAPVAVGEAAGLVAMASFGGELYGVSGATGKVRRYTQTGWVEAYDSGVSPLLSLGQAFGELMAGASDGKVYSLDAGLWSLRLTLDPGRPVTAIRGYGVWNSVDRATVPRVAVALSRPAGSAASAEVKVLSADGIVERALNCGEPRVPAMAEYHGRLYVATSWGTAGIGGRLLCFDGNSGTREAVLSEVAAFSDGSPVSLAVSDGLLWIGLSNGRIAATDGVRAVPAVDVAVLGHGPSPVAGMVDFGGRLFACFGDAGLGACLLSRLPAATSDGAAGLGGAADGWSLPSYTGTAGDGPATLAVHQGDLFLALTSGSASYSRRRDPDAARPYGEATTSLFDSGEPVIEKRLGRVLVSHEALATGQSVHAYASTAGPDGPWVDLGVSNQEGSAFAALPFPAGTLGRLVWLRVMLATAGACGPRLRGVVLEYEPVGDGKTRWEMEVRCEGAPGLPLRLLDGSTESSNGAELSAALRAAGGKGAVAFEDLDGAVRTVRVEAVSESLGKLVQEHGTQTVAVVRLAEW
ncbi:MAG TPA: hypothetical protein VF960_01570 [Chloroflexota bacterium]